MNIRGHLFLPVVRRAAVAAIGLIAIAISPATAQQGAGAQACRADFRSFCGGTVPGGGRILRCLADHESQLSGGCRAALAGRGRQPGSTEGEELGASNDRHPAKKVAADVRVKRDVAYGSAAEQRMDVYLPPKAQGAPIIVMVHGGGWAAGSKSASGVVDNKVAHWLPRGFIFVSVETRLLPVADPLDQARDVAAALASVQRMAATWGGDGARIVLMGHSAGAHLVALVSADRSLAEKAGVKPWAGTVALDSAAYDVAAIMTRPRHPALYDRAFGGDPDFWARVSPTLRLKEDVPPMLLVCSSLRQDSCPQAKAFEKKAGRQVDVLPVALRHGAINAELGTESDYTRKVDAFLTSIGLR